MLSFIGYACATFRCLYCSEPYCLYNMSKLMSVSPYIHLMLAAPQSQVGIMATLPHRGRNGLIGVPSYTASVCVCESDFL